MEIKTFRIEDSEYSVRFVSSDAVVEGVRCDVYEVGNSDEMDLGIITINPGFVTPAQKVILGEKTIEGYVSGGGELHVLTASGASQNYIMQSGVDFALEVNFGDTMQWRATRNEDLVVYEVCFPPYAEGRFQNLSEFPKSL